ncbi:MAG: hypothetical protein HY552_01880 [Elusimicrobia bacterium]|nr:hypothetical protein [Elusimicrobiota bacterium]
MGDKATIGIHRRIRDRLARVATSLGQGEGVGWDDQASVDLPRLEARELRLEEAVRKQVEADRAWAEALAADGREEEAAALRERDEEVERELKLLRAVTCSCDGRHVYPIRCVLARLSDTVKRVLSYHEGHACRCSGAGGTKPPRAEP